MVARCNIALSVCAQPAALLFAGTRGTSLPTPVPIPVHYGNPQLIGKVLPRNGEMGKELKKWRNVQVLSYASNWPAHQRFFLGGAIVSRLTLKRGPERPNQHSFICFPLTNRKILPKPEFCLDEVNKNKAAVTFRHSAENHRSKEATHWGPAHLGRGASV